MDSNTKKEPVYTLGLLFYSVLVLMGCNIGQSGHSESFEADRAQAKKIADGLHYLSEDDYIKISNSCAEFNEKISPRVVRFLISDHWNDERPSAIDRSFSVYTFDVPDKYGKLGTSNHNGTVGSFIYLALDRLTCSEETLSVNPEQLKTLFERNGYDFRLVRKVRESGSPKKR